MIAIEEVPIAMMRLDSSGRVTQRHDIALPGSLAPQSETSRHLNVAVLSVEEVQAMRFEVVSARASQH